jgi:hypothetical protein
LRNRFHQDHIFPDSFFKKSELKKRGVPDHKQSFYINSNDLIGNLQLLEDLPNEEKLNKDFNIWLEEMHPKIEERSEFMRKHYIPQDVDLSFENFEEFL